MRDNLSMVPIVEDSMSHMPNFSSNGYYGYQPPMKQHEAPMEVQHSRKRAWDYGSEPRDLKRRRQTEVARKPTHNIPDMPRCIMGHYF